MFFRLWEVVSPEDAVAEVRNVEDPVLASKRLQDLAQSYGCEDNLSIMIVRLGQSQQDLLMRELSYTLQVCTLIVLFFFFFLFVEMFN